jgi:hypothetical protein
VKIAVRSEALIRASVDHWARLADLNPLEGEQYGNRDCPLCQEFGTIMDCRGCPIAQHTGWSSCRETPYDKAANALWYLSFRERTRVTTTDMTACREKARRTAGEMLEFLVSLLPGGRQ